MLALDLNLKDAIQLAKCPSEATEADNWLEAKGPAPAHHSVKEALVPLDLEDIGWELVLRLQEPGARADPLSEKNAER